MKNAKDDLIGVSFPSPKVKRYVEKLIWDSYAEEWRMDQVYEGKSEDGYENSSIEGTVSIGDFTLDDELVSRLSVVKRAVMKKDFSDVDIAHMESTGALINEDINFYYSTGPTVKRKLDKKTYMRHRDWNGKYLVHWDMWDPSKDDGVTVVGVQKGNKLTYQVLNTVSSVDKIMDKAEFNKKVSGSPIDTKYGYGVLAVVFAFLGIRSLSKSRVSEKNED